MGASGTITGASFHSPPYPSYVVEEKLEDNRRRDGEVVARLKELGWRVLIIWECSFRKPQTIVRRPWTGLHPEPAGS